MTLLPTNNKGNESYWGKIGHLFKKNEPTEPVSV